LACTVKMSCRYMATGRHPNGMPFGIQLMGRPFDEARLFAAAAHLF
jgi:Asp-tRNA(Asn)/Glu-tRNA(Gln) amidotransferase A subunit family amidase